MNTAIQFKNFDRFEHLQDFALDSIDHTLGKFDRDDKMETRMTVESLVEKSGSHRPVFECEIVVIGSQVNRPIVVKKKDFDFYQAIRACLKASRKILRRASKMRISNRRKIAQNIRTEEDQLMKQRLQRSYL